VRVAPSLPPRLSYPACVLLIHHERKRARANMSDYFDNLSESEVLALLSTPLETSCPGSRMKQASVPLQVACEEGFKPGKPHIQNKFCATCRQGFAISGANLRCLSPELMTYFTNTTRAGFWNTPDPMRPEPMHQVPYRVINQHRRCQGPPMIWFRGPAPALDFAPMPAGVVRPHSGEVWLRVCYGTLVPIVASSLADEQLRSERGAIDDSSCSMVSSAPAAADSSVVPALGPLAAVAAVCAPDQAGVTVAQKRPFSAVKGEEDVAQPREILLREAQRARALADKLEAIAAQHTQDQLLHAMDPKSPGPLSAQLEELRQESTLLSWAVTQIAPANVPTIVAVPLGMGARPLALARANSSHLQQQQQQQQQDASVAASSGATPHSMLVPGPALEYSRPPSAPSDQAPSEHTSVSPSAPSADQSTSEQPSVPPSPPATPLTADDEKSRSVAFESLSLLMNPNTLAFRDQALEREYLGEVTRMYAGPQGIAMNGAIVMSYVAFIVKYIQDGRGVRPCSSVVSMGIPCMMAFIGLLSHIPVGRMSNAFSEHRFLVWVSAFNVAFGLVAYLVTKIFEPAGCSPAYQVDFLYGPLYREPELLFFCGTISAVVIAISVLGFPFLFRIGYPLACMILSSIVPRVSRESKAVEVAFFWPWVLVAGGIGHLIATTMRIKFLAKQRLIPSTTRSGSEAYRPLRIALLVSYAVMCAGWALRSSACPHVWSGSISPSLAAASGIGNANGTARWMED
jgi:hypothetical protein